MTIIITCILAGSSGGGGTTPVQKVAAAGAVANVITNNPLFAPVGAGQRVSPAVANSLLVRSTAERAVDLIAEGANEFVDPE